MDKFEKACQIIKKIDNVSDNDKLFLYAHYKQINNGNNNEKEPSYFQFVENAKWKAWKKLEGMSKEEAMNQYINKVKEIIIAIRK